MKYLVPFLILASIVFISCEEDKPKKSLKKTSTDTQFQRVERPSFDSEAAFNYVKKQVDFGPRVPGTEEHKKCAAYLESELAALNWTTEVQEAEVTAFDGAVLPIYNITGRFNPTSKNRIMLFAHWDSRPFADRDEHDINKAILGANDGASGVGVLLAIAKAIAEDSLKPKVGIDIVFFDAEDYGKPSNAMSGQDGNTWCLGSQYWSNHIAPDFIKPRYGVLLDMVGAPNAIFPREAVSLKFNPSLVDRVWFLANKLGYGNYFIQDIAYGGITDDHLYVNELTGIPSIDIIHYDPTRRDFGDFHHRHTDNMDIIDPRTLGAVGETMLELIYRER